MMSENSEENKKLLKLIREVCREEIGTALDEHLTDYKHKSRPVSGEVLDNELRNRSDHATLLHNGLSAQRRASEIKETQTRR